MIYPTFEDECERLETVRSYYLCFGAIYSNDPLYIEAVLKNSYKKMAAIIAEEFVAPHYKVRAKMATAKLCRFFDQAIQATQSIGYGVVSAK